MTDATLVPFELVPDQIAVADLALAVGVWPDVGAAWWFPPGQLPQTPHPPPKFPLVHQQCADGSSVVAGCWSIGWLQLSEADRRSNHDLVGQVGEPWSQWSPKCC